MGRLWRTDCVATPPLRTAQRSVPTMSRTAQRSVPTMSRTAQRSVPTMSPATVRNSSMSGHPPKNTGESPHRKPLGHFVPYWVKPGAVFFITICTQPRWLNQLCNRETADRIFEAVNHRQANNSWFCRLCLLMPDHLHALISFPATESMAKVVRNFKEHTAKRSSVNWQRDFFDHRLRDERNLQLKADYIRQNPVRAGLTSSADQWPYLWTPATR